LNAFNIALSAFRQTVYRLRVAGSKNRRRVVARVDVYRAGDSLIIEPAPGAPLRKRPARRLADADAVVCGLEGTSMKVRLPRALAQQAITNDAGDASELSRDIGTLRLLNLSAVKRRAGIPDPVIPAWLKSACERLRTHSDSATPMTDIARSVGVHPVHLSRTFAKAFRRTMTTRVQEVRVEGACRDVLLTNRSFSRIAADHGFADQSHLTRSLKKATGLTPNQLRRKAR
jgi:AraC-like DNA-binding protein